MISSALCARHNRQKWSVRTAHVVIDVKMLVSPGTSQDNLQELIDDGICVDTFAQTSKKSVERGSFSQRGMCDRKMLVALNLFDISGIDHLQSCRLQSAVKDLFAEQPRVV